ncbi:MAG: MFS transporter [Clostridiaceae bacterium]|nr:MFS transporter [Clostridiaceae bacterium]
MGSKLTEEFTHPTEKELETNRLLGIFEGSSARIILNLTSGAFLVGFLKYIGASDAVCGYIIALPVLAAVIQFLSPIILESLSRRMKIIKLGSAVHRLSLSALIVIPFLPINTSAKLWIAGIIFLISHLILSFVTPAVSTMYVSFVPQSIRGRYFGMRESYMLASATIVTLILGKVLDNFTDAGNEIMGHVVVYATIFLFTVINYLSYHFMKEVSLDHSKERLKIKDIFTLPLKDRRFIYYFVMLVLWNISLQIASAFFSVYLKSDLNMNYTTITVLSTINSILYIISAKRWGRFADKHGWATTTMITIGILGICHGIWFFSFKGSPILIVLMVLAHVLGGIAWSGINVSIFNLQFDFTPDENRMVYIGFSAAISGIIGYIAALIGSKLVSLFETDIIPILGIDFNIKQLLFLSSSLLMLLCSFYIYFFMGVKNNKKVLKIFGEYIHSRLQSLNLFLNRKGRGYEKD